MSTPISEAVRRSAFRMGLRSTIEIAASPARVWEVISNFDDYPLWNPALPEVRGEAVAGTLLQAVIQWPGLKKTDYQLEVLTAARDRELRWLGHFGTKGFMDGDHRFIIEPNGASGVRLSQTEELSGLLIPFFAPWLRKNVLDGFNQMNIALKNRSERIATRDSAQAP